MTEQKPRKQGTIGASIDQYGFVYIGEQRFEPIEKRIAVELQLDQALKRIKILDAEIGEQKLKHNYAAFERNQCVENNSKLRSQLTRAQELLDVARKALDAAKEAQGEGRWLPDWANKQIDEALAKIGKPT